MRQIGSLSSEQQAQRFAAHLVTRGVESHPEQDGDRWAIWVRDENDVDQARQALELFQVDPDDRRYDGAQREAEAIQRKRQQEQLAAQKNFIEVRQRWQQPTARDAPVTVAIIVLSVVVTLVGGFGKAKEGVGLTVNQRLSFCELASFKAAKGNPLVNIAQGQVWRLVTPVFVHLGVLHLVFNMLWFFQFGASIEKLRGTWRLVGLILVSGVIANVAQAVAPPEWGGTPFFGGMSGVLYGLFGYIWMKSLFAPGSGFYLPQFTVIILIGWLFLCMTPAVPDVANVAHVVGLVVGMAVGYIPTLWRR